MSWVETDQAKGIFVVEIEGVVREETLDPIQLVHLLLATFHQLEQKKKP